MCNIQPVLRSKRQGPKTTMLIQKCAITLEWKDVERGRNTEHLQQNNHSKAERQRSRSQCQLSLSVICHSEHILMVKNAIVNMHITLAIGGHNLLVCVIIIEN